MIVADCVSAVAGFVVGFGILGAVAQGPIIAFTYHFLGRIPVFLVVMVFALLPVAAIGRAKRLDSKYHRPSIKLAKPTPQPKVVPQPTGPSATTSLVAETEIKTPVKVKPQAAVGKLN
jgi:hypothetical protein